MKNSWTNRAKIKGLPDLVLAKVIQLSQGHTALSPTPLKWPLRGLPSGGGRSVGPRGEHRSHGKACPAVPTVPQGAPGAPCSQGLSCQRTSASAGITSSWCWDGGRCSPWGQRARSEVPGSGTGHSWTEFPAGAVRTSLPQARFSHGSATMNRVSSEAAVTPGCTEMILEASGCK